MNICLKKKKNGIFFLVLLSLFITGCPSGGEEEYSTTNEIYAVGWILHNVDDSTPTVLDYKKEELANYTYYFNYPSYTPYTYSNILWWIHPGQSGAAASWMDIAVPGKRTYYVMGKNPVPENYKRGWMFSTKMYINYIGEDFGYETAQQEHYQSLYAFDGIKPVPGDKKEIYFGTAPFRLSPVIIEDNKIRLKDWPVKGYNGNSFLYRKTEIRVIEIFEDEEEIKEYSLPKPHYEIYLNNELIKEDDLVGTESKIWDYNQLYYYIQEEGDYLVKLTIPTNYPVWENIEENYRFSYPPGKTLGKDDINPPYLDKLEFSPRFEVNKKINIIASIIDDSELIKDIKTYYQTEGDWIELKGNFNKAGISRFKTDLTITDENVEKINLKIYAEDRAGNSAEYIIKPVSLKARDVNFNLNINKLIDENNKIPIEETDLAKGDIISIEGICIDDKSEACGGLKLDLSLNNEYQKSTINTLKEDEKGQFNFEYQIPLDYNLDKAEFEISFDGTGVYLPKKEKFSMDIKTFDHDLAAGNIEAEELEYGKSTNIKTKLYNIGRYKEENIKVKLYVDYKLIETKYIESLEVNEVMDIEFEWVVNVAKYKDIYVVVEIDNDENLDNNIRTKEVYIKYDAPDLIGYIRWREEDYTLNKIDYVQVNIANYGTKKNTDTKARLYYLYDVKYIVLFEENQLEILYFNDKEYVTKFNIENNKIKLYVDYDNTEENFEISDNQVIKLKDGIFVNVRISYSYYSEEENYAVELVFAKEFNEIGAADVSNLKGGEKENIDIEWVPKKIGKYVLKLFIDDKEDIDLANNYDYKITYVAEDAPDLEAYIDYDWEEDFIVNEESTLKINIKNIGTQAATNNKIELYDIYDYSQFWNSYEEEDSTWFDDTEYKITFFFIEKNKAKISVSYNGINEDFILLAGETIILQNGRLLELLAVSEDDAVGRISDGIKKIEKNIESLDANEEFTKDIKYIPDKKGGHILKLFVKTDKDRNLDNNYDEDWIEAKIKGPDLRGDIWVDNGVVNEISNIYVEIINRGTEKAENVIADLYDNGILINKSVFDEFYVEDVYKGYTVEWVPTERGKHNITLDIKADNDVDLENNKISVFAEVYEIIDANFKITDDNGNFVERGLTISDDYYTEGIQYILNSERIISIPSYISIIIANASGMEEGIDFDEEMNYFFYTSFLGSAGQENMNVISEQYGEREEDNLKLYFVYANKADWDYENSVFLFYYKDITKLNPDLSPDYFDELNTFYCAKWNFENENCNSEWLEADTKERYENGNRFGIRVGTDSKKEAFALGMH